MSVSTIHSDNRIEQDLEGWELTSCKVCGNSACQMSTCAEAHHAYQVRLYREFCGIITKIPKCCSAIIERDLGVPIREIIGKQSSREAEVIVKRGPIRAFVATSNKGITATRNEDYRLTICFIFRSAEYLEHRSCREFDALDRHLAHFANSKDTAHVVDTAPETQVSACSTILIDIRMRVVCGKEEAFVALNDAPFVGSFGKDCDVVLLFVAINLAKCLGDIRAVINDDSIVRIALERPLIGVSKQVFLRSSRVTLVSFASIHEVSTFAKSEVIPVCITHIGRGLKREAPSCCNENDVFLFL